MKMYGGMTGERIAFRSPNYTKILNAMRAQPSLTLKDIQNKTGISIAAIQKLLNQLLDKKYVERGIKGYILLSAVTLGLQACNDDDSYTGNATLSDCITYKNAYDEHAIDSLCFTMRNDVLLFNHRSALVNCDTEGANVQVQTQGNTLIIEEEYLGKQEANCNCMMNLDYAIRNLPHQTYRIKLITPTATLAEFELKVDEKTEAIITYPRYK